MRLGLNYGICRVFLQFFCLFVLGDASESVGNALVSESSSRSPIMCFVSCVLRLGASIRFLS